MKMKKLFLLTLCLGSSLTLSTSCQKESNITKVCMLKTVDSMNLYLTAVAKGNVSSTYIYLNDKCNDGVPNLKEYAHEVYTKASNTRPNCDIAYFPVTDEGVVAIKSLFEEDKETKLFKIVYFDSYDKNEDGKLSNITGIWVARNGWINNKNNTGRKFIDGLAKTANYRASKMKDKTGEDTSSTNNDYKMFHEKFNGETFNTFNEMYTFMDSKKNELPEYVFVDDKNESRINYKSIYEYCALFAMQNTGALQPFNDAKVLDYFKNNSMRDDKKEHFINNDTAESYFGKLQNIGKEDKEKDKQISEEGKALINDLMKKFDITSEEGKNERLSLDLMRHGIYHANDKSSSSGLSKVILWSAIGGGLFVIVVTLLIVRRVKTGKKLFDIKKALDSDIDPEDPRIIRMKKVGKDLKALREKKKIPLNIAAKEMHIPSIYIKDVIEEGEVVLNKRLRKKYIAYYKLPEDYFDKAYKLDK